MSKADDALRALKTVVQDYSRRPAEGPAFVAMVNDLARGKNKFTRAIGESIELRVAQEIEEEQGSPSLLSRRETFTNRLVDGAGLDAGIAAWTVDAWLVAYRVIEQPMVPDPDAPVAKPAPAPEFKAAEPKREPPPAVPTPQPAFTPPIQTPTSDAVHVGNGSNVSKGGGWGAAFLVGGFLAFVLAAGITLNGLSKRDEPSSPEVGTTGSYTPPVVTTPPDDPVVESTTGTSTPEPTPPFEDGAVTPKVEETPDETEDTPVVTTPPEPEKWETERIVSTAADDKPQIDLELAQAFPKTMKVSDDESFVATFRATCLRSGRRLSRGSITVSVSGPASFSLDSGAPSAAEVLGIGSPMSQRLDGKWEKMASTMLTFEVAVDKWKSGKTLQIPLLIKPVGPGEIVINVRSTISPDGVPMSSTDGLSDLDQQLLPVKKYTVTVEP